MKYDVKITVMKREFYPELAQEVIEQPFGPCDKFIDAQEFIIDNINKYPEKFCPWAWADIQRDVAMILYGATPEPLLKNPHSIYVCCDEGIRPVIFKIERIILE